VQQGWRMQPRTQPASHGACHAAWSQPPAGRRPAVPPHRCCTCWCHRCGGARWCAVHAARGASPPALLLPPLGPAGAAARPGRPRHPPVPPHRTHRGAGVAASCRGGWARLCARAARPAAARRATPHTPPHSPGRGCGSPAGIAAAAAGGGAARCVGVGGGDCVCAQRRVGAAPRAVDAWLQCWVHPALVGWRGQLPAVRRFPNMPPHHRQEGSNPTRACSSVGRAHDLQRVHESQPLKLHEVTGSQLYLHHRIVFRSIPQQAVPDVVQLSDGTQPAAGPATATGTDSTVPPVGP
jgi:hypothetical protein